MAAFGLLMVLPSLAFAGYRCANPLVQLRDSLMLFLSFMKIRVFLGSKGRNLLIIRL